MSEKKYPRGWGKYKKLTKGWESYVMDSLYPKFLKEFPDQTVLTQARTNDATVRVAKWLVDNDWMEEIQSYTYKSYVASGMNDMTFREFKEDLLHYTTYSGKNINAWKNSMERSVARKIVNRMKKEEKHFNKRITKIRKTDSVAYLKQSSKTMVAPPKGFSKRLRGLEVANMTDAQYEKELNYVKAVIEKDIVELQTKEFTKSMFEGDISFQGKRISKDQLQKGNNNLLIIEKKAAEKIIKESDEELILEGQWFVSPSHNYTHYYSGGEDPCNIYEDQRYFYGNDIPVPVNDSHFGCGCRVELKVIKKSQMHK